MSRKVKGLQKKPHEQKSYCLKATSVVESGKLNQQQK
jgi:hypothetical protein